MKNKNIINLTPHDINIVDGEGNVLVVLPGTETPARAMQAEKALGVINDIPVIGMEFGEPENLPTPEDGVWLLVSKTTADAALKSGRTVADLLLTGKTVRDANNRIIGCQALSAYDSTAFQARA